MGKKRDLGILILGIFLIIFALLQVPKIYVGISSFGKETVEHLLPKIAMAVFWTLLLFMLGINLFRTKEWARKGAIYFTLYCIIMVLFRMLTGSSYDTVIHSAATILFDVLIIYYLTRPKVKEQFK